MRQKNDCGKIVFDSFFEAKKVINKLGIPDVYYLWLLNNNNIQRNYNYKFLYFFDSGNEAGYLCSVDKIEKDVVTIKYRDHVKY